MPLFSLLAFVYTTENSQDTAMSDPKTTPLDSENLLITLDQISQTMDVMGGIVNRLRLYVSEQTTPIKRGPPDKKTSGKQAITLYDRDTLH